MNKTIKKMLAAVLVVCCLPMVSMTATADAPASSVPGTTALSDLDGMEPIQDRGKIGNGKGTVYVYRETLPYPAVMIVSPPTENRIRFVLRDDIDQVSAEQQVLEAVNVYFPGLLSGYEKKSHYAYQTVNGRSLAYFHRDVDMPLAYDLIVYEGNPGWTSESEAGLLLALAKQHLISEFYGWGHTADYTVAEFGEDVLCGYRKKLNHEDPAVLDELKAYLEEHCPGCAVKEYDELMPDGVTKIGRYDITTPADMGFREKVELACTLDEQFHIGVNCAVLVGTNSPVVSGNALAQAGDVTLDTELTIVDVIALNKNLMVGEPLCDTAKKNADVDGDGTPDERDSLAILKEVVEITKGFVAN